MARPNASSTRIVDNAAGLFNISPLTSRYKNGKQHNLYFVQSASELDRTREGKKRIASSRSTAHAESARVLCAAIMPTLHLRAEFQSWGILSRFF